MASFLSQRLDAHDREVLLDALEASASQTGLAITIYRVDVVPPRTLYVSDAAEALFRRPVAELGEGSPLRYLVPTDAARVQALIAARVVGDPPTVFEAEAVRGDGTNVQIEVGVARIRSPLGELSVCHIRDVTARREMVEALRRSEERFRTLVEKAPDGVVILRQGRIVFANARASALLGVHPPDTVVGRMIASLQPPADAQRAGERIAAMLHDGVEFPPSEYGVLSDPTRVVEIKSIPWEWEGQIAVLAFARDVSDRAALRRELVRADRLAAVGTLAAAVAHEINNPLTYAALSLDLVEPQLEAAGQLALLEHVRNAREGLARVATIVRDLSAYAREQVVVAGPVELEGVVERALKLVDHVLRHRARVVRRYAPVPTVEGDAGRLEQVFVNLLVNAAQAVDGAEIRDVTVDTRVGAGGEIVASVLDSGPGVPAELRERIFEPFFTTKAVGEGTGLGLSVVRSLVEAMGGRIDVGDGEGGGTRFAVTLRPFVGPRSATPAPVAARPNPRLRVLVVDDEPLIRRVVAFLLEPTHDVVVVGGGEEALAALAARPFDALVCDLMMPGMTGMDLHEAIARVHPGVERRMVFVTGGAFVPRLASFLEAIVNPKVSKPFDEAQLLHAISTAAAR